MVDDLVFDEDFAVVPIGEVVVEVFVEDWVIGDESWLMLSDKIPIRLVLMSAPHQLYR